MMLALANRFLSLTAKCVFHCASAFCVCICVINSVFPSSCSKHQSGLVGMVSRMTFH